MKIRRFMTIAGLGLAVIRPARADEPGVVRVAYTTEHVRAAGRVLAPVLDGEPTPPAIPTPAASDAAVGATRSQVVTDYPPSQAFPGYGKGGPPSVVPGQLPGPDSGPASPQAPGVIPGIPVPPAIPGPAPVGPTPAPPTEDVIPSPRFPAEVEPVPPVEPPEPFEPVPPIPSPVIEPVPPVEPPELFVPEAAPTPPVAEAIPPEAFAGDLGAGASGAQTTLASLAARGTFGTPEVFGDSLGRSVLQFFPRPPQPPPPLPQPPVPPRPPSPFEPVESAALVPTIRNIKLSENQSPAPRDRLIYQFNFFNNVNESINRRFQSPITNIRVYRHIFGIEKTFFNEMTSVGVRLPLNTITADSPLPNIGQTETSLGNLEIFAKYVLYVDPAAGRLLSTGFAISPSTGPSRFAGASYLPAINNTTIQPFVGGIFIAGRFFFQGFTSIEVPFARNDVTILYNDYAIGYFLYRSQTPDRFLTAVTPTFEVHVNTPLNHRGVRLDDPLGTPDFVNLTYGTAFDFGRRTRLLAALVTPVTGPQPFDFEWIASLNIYY